MKTNEEGDDNGDGIFWCNERIDGVCSGGGGGIFLFDCCTECDVSILGCIHEVGGGVFVNGVRAGGGNDTSFKGVILGTADGGIFLNECTEECKGGPILNCECIDEGDEDRLLNDEWTEDDGDLVLNDGIPEGDGALFLNGTDEGDGGIFLNGKCNGGMLENDECFNEGDGGKFVNDVCTDGCLLTPINDDCDIFWTGKRAGGGGGGSGGGGFANMGGGNLT